VGGQAGVLNGVADDQSVTGTPAVDLNQAKRNWVSMKHLPEVRRKLQEFDRAFKNLIKGK